jgi:hypothetical protein
MIGFYNWLICKLFNRCKVYIENKPKSAFQIYCEENPGAIEAKIFDL